MEDLNPTLILRAGEITYIEPSGAVVLGIDPGLSGAWAMLDLRGKVLGCDVLPVIRDQGTAWIDGPALLQQLCTSAFDWPVHDHKIAYVERVHAMPKQGVTSVFTFGMGFGSILPTLQHAGFSIRFVTPNVWKKSLGLTKDKSLSRDRARLMFPGVRLDRVKDTNMAEALLIAHYGREQQRIVQSPIPPSPTATA